MKPSLCSCLSAFLLSAALAWGEGGGSSHEVDGKARAEGARVIVNQVDTSAYPRVSIFATVLKDGVPLRGLAEPDFRVREDGVEQLPLTVVPKPAPLSVVLAIDVSGSMKRKMAETRAAAQAFVASLSPEDRIHIVTFERRVLRLTPEEGVGRERAAAIIATTQARGDTRLYDGMIHSVFTLKDIPGRRAVVLLSDGADDNGKGGRLSEYTLDQAIAYASDVNVPVYTIGLGSGIDEVVLHKAATRTGGLYAKAPTLAELRALYARIRDQLGGQYYIYYTATKPGDGRSHELELEFDGVTGRKTFKAPVHEEEAVVVESTFEEGTDDWGVVGDGRRGKDPNLEGSAIRADDDAVGGVWYWNAPQRYLGNKSNFLGGRLVYRARITKVTSPFDDVNEIELHGDGLVLGFNTKEVPGVEWKEFTVPLTAAANWTNTATGQPATAEEFKTVLSNLKQLLIRGEYQTGADSGWLDKVSLQERR